MKELIAKIEEWAEARNIINGSKPIDQAMKLFSEFGELADNVGKGRDCRDDIGDCAVVLIVISKQLGETVSNIDIGSINWKYGNKSLVAEISGLLYDFVCASKADCWDYQSLSFILEYLDFIAKSVGSSLEECVQIAYNDISKRRGILWNGVFIKSTDDNYDEIKSMYEKSIENNHQI